jgi:hypothetical protein
MFSPMTERPLVTGLTPPASMPKRAEAEAAALRDRIHKLQHRVAQLEHRTVAHAGAHRSMVSGHHS